MSPKRIGTLPNLNNQARHLPATLSVDEAADLLGVARSTAYEQVAAAVKGEPHDWPVPVLKVGGRLRVPTKPVLDLLALDAPLPAWVRLLVTATPLDIEN